MVVTHTNAVNVNKKRLQLFSLVAKRTLTQLITQCDDDVLIDLKNQKELDKLTTNMNNVLVSKLRDKFKI